MRWGNGLSPETSLLCKSGASHEGCEIRWSYESQEGHRSAESTLRRLPFSTWGRSARCNWGLVSACRPLWETNYPTVALTHPIKCCISGHQIEGVCVCVCKHVYRDQMTPCGNWSFPFIMCIPGINSGCWAWLQAPLLAEPSYWSWLFLSSLKCSFLLLLLLLVFFNFIFYNLSSDNFGLFSKVLVCLKMVWVQIIVKIYYTHTQFNSKFNYFYQGLPKELKLF